MSILARVMAAAGLVMLAGCAGPSVVQTSDDPQAMISSYYDYGAGGRDLRLEVRGDPFVGPARSFVQRVEAEANLQSLRQPTHVTATPGPTAMGNFSVVLAFSQAGWVDGELLCHGGGRQVDQGGRVRLVAAFCVSGRALTVAEGEVAAEGPEDPRFAELIRQVMLALFRPDLTPGGGKG